MSQVLQANQTLQTLRAVRNKMNLMNLQKELQEATEKLNKYDIRGPVDLQIQRNVSMLETRMIQQQIILPAMPLCYFGQILSKHPPNNACESL